MGTAAGGDGGGRRRVDVARRHRLGPDRAVVGHQLGPPSPCTDADRHRRGQALRTVPTRSFAEQCVESHTWPPALSYRTPRYDIKLQAERSGHWTTTACAPPAC